MLGSGSSGNAVLVESEGRRLLIDAGFSCRELERRLKEVGVEPGAVEAIVLTHEHGDHCRGVVRFARRHAPRVYASPGTMAGRHLRALPGALPLRAGAPFEAAGLRVEPFAISHDAREPVGLVVEDGAGHRLGVAGDLGEPTAGAMRALREVSMLVLETNHDLEMLRRGPYPWRLKQRVASRHGHLSNVAAAHSLAELVSDRLRTVVLYHLSRINNLPALALEAVAGEIERLGCAAQIELTDQFAPTAWMDL